MNKKIYPNPRLLNASWTVTHDATLTKPKIDVAKLTKEEQADLIIKRLTNGHNEDLLEEVISAKMSKLIADEIDKEIRQSLLTSYFSLKGTK